MYHKRRRLQKGSRSYPHLLNTTPPPVYQLRKPYTPFHEEITKPPPHNEETLALSLSLDDEVLADRKAHEVQQTQDEHAGPHGVNRGAPQPLSGPLVRSTGIILLRPLAERVEHWETAGKG